MSTKPRCAAERTHTTALGIMFRALVYLAAASIATTAAAQQATSKASAPAPALTYDSAFESYRPYREEPAADWRTVNDEVGRVGGHIGIAGGAAGHGAHGGAKPSPGSAPTAQPTVRCAPAAPAGTGHAGHH